MHISSVATIALGCLSGLVQGTPTPPQPPTYAANPWNDTKLVSIFDGKTLNGWTASQTGEYNVVDGSIHATGKARGWLYYNMPVGNFRLVFQVRQAAALPNQGHNPAFLFWGTTNPLRDALSALQFQPDTPYTWDYRPGKNVQGASNTIYDPPNKNIGDWHQCEVIADNKSGVAQMACCQVPTGAATCKTRELVRWSQPDAGKVGVFALQTHNTGLQDEYKDLYLETNLAQQKFITS